MEGGWDSVVSSDWLRVAWSEDRISVKGEPSCAVHTGSEAHPPFCILGTGYFLKVKQWGCTDHPPPSSARLQISGSYMCALHRHVIGRPFVLTTNPLKSTATPYKNNFYIRFYLILCTMYPYCYVYVFLVLGMFRSRYCVSLCCSVYCLCVNVYCTAATGCQPNCS